VRSTLFAVITLSQEIATLARRSALAALIHEEHQQTLEFLNALEERVSGRGRRRPLAPDDRALAEQLEAKIDAMIFRHFAIEETVVFPLVQDSLGGDAVLMLIREHEGVGSLASPLRAAAHAALCRPLTAQEWARFCETAEAFIDQETFHIQKEETLIVNRLPELLDHRDDAAAADCYIAIGGLPAMPRSPSDRPAVQARTR
jgi:hemerythrin-like domain-containing protein